VDGSTQSYLLSRALYNNSEHLPCASPSSFTGSDRPADTPACPEVSSTSTILISKANGSVRMTDLGKQVVFRYNDDDTDTDVEVDILGDLPHYTVGDLVARRGKSWRIIRVLSGEALIGSKAVSSYIVDLSD
jgi:hypothetical protein